MQQWLDVFTTDLNIFEYVHASVNIPTFHSASVRFCGRYIFWFDVSHYPVQLTLAWGKLNRIWYAFRFHFMLRI